MLNCRRVTQIFSEGLERPLTLKEKMSLKFHTMMCAGCRNFGLQMQDIRKFSRSYSEKDHKDEKNIE